MNKDTLITAIKGSAGTISTIAARLDVAWHTAKKYIELDDDAKKAMADEEETLIDLAENVVIRSITEGNTHDAKWYLATKGKRRGYSERHEITGADNAPIAIEIVPYKGDDG